MILFLSLRIRISNLIDNFAIELGVNGPINGDVILSNTDITVTNVVNKEEADIINGYNNVSGTVTLTSVTDILENVNALSTTARFCSRS